jgi:hypothetical protein
MNLIRKMKCIEHKSRLRYLAHNPTGELVKVITHQFTTADKRNRIDLRKWFLLSKESK